MAFCKMGNGHLRALHPRKRTSEIPHSRHRLLHQMDRSQTISHHHNPTGSAVRLERYYMPIWCATHHYNRQFINKELAKFYTDLGIKHFTSSVEHSQTNGQAEAANKVILVELQKRLDGAKGRWPKDLLEVLWAYRCTP